MKTMTEMASLQNHLLIAMPGLADPNFSKSVTYLCQHSAAGALGIVINRSSGLNLAQLLEQMNIPCVNRQLSSHPVLLGGPVEPHRGFVLHARKGSWMHCQAISEHICLTTSRDILEALAQSEGPEDYLIALGCAGWGSGQIEQELLDNSWLNTPADDSILFTTPLEQRWTQATTLLGIDPSRLAEYSGRA